MTLLGIAILLSPIADPSSWSMADLEAAAAAGSWREVVRHIGDVPPTTRTDGWKALLRRSAHELLVSQQDHMLATVGLAVGLVDEYPQLARDRAFMSKRAELGFPRFEQCFAERYGAEACYELLVHFVRQDPSRRSLAFDAGKLVVKEMAYTAALPLFHFGIPEKKNSKQCSDRAPWLAADQALDRLEGDAKHLTLAKELAFDRCWPAWKNDLIKSVTQSDRYLDNACRELLKKGVLTGVRRKKCRRHVAEVRQ